jgi:hypothetical protein
VLLDDLLHPGGVFAVNLSQPFLGPFGRGPLLLQQGDDGLAGILVGPHPPQQFLSKFLAPVGFAVRWVMLFPLSCLSRFS